LKFHRSLWAVDFLELAELAELVSPKEASCGTGVCVRGCSGWRKDEAAEAGCDSCVFW